MKGIIISLFLGATLVACSGGGGGVAPCTQAQIDALNLMVQGEETESLFLMKSGCDKLRSAGISGACKAVNLESGEEFDINLNKAAEACNQVDEAYKMSGSSTSTNFPY
jgi:hypothetical protein